MNIKSLISILIMALVTYLIRVFPMIILKKKFKSKLIKSFLYYTPFAVLGAMTFPAIFYSTENVNSSVIGAVAAILLAYFNKSLLVVAIGSVVSVYFFEVIF